MDNKQENSKEKFTKAVWDGKYSPIDVEVDDYNFTGGEVVRPEIFPKANLAAVTIKYDSVFFNVRAIRKLIECSHIIIIMQFDLKRMIAKPCDEDDKGAVQWSRIDKHSKVISRKFLGKGFTAKLFKDMNWDTVAIYKILGTLIKFKDERILVFDLTDAERYLFLAATSEDNPRRTRVAYPAPHWEENWGESYEAFKTPRVKTSEGMSVEIKKSAFPQLPFKEAADSKDVNPQKPMENGTT
jgi:hypothetical protein